MNILQMNTYEENTNEFLLAFGKNLKVKRNWDLL